MTVPSLALVVVPLLMLAIIWTVSKISWMTIISATLFWLQTVILCLVLLTVLNGSQSQLVLSNDFCIDRLGALFAILSQVIVAGSMTHAALFFHFDKQQEGGGIRDVRIFYSCVTLLMVAMTVVFFCNNLGAMWIGIETTTLCSAPLVLFHKDKHSLEATWKYLMVCGVGIAFALLGTMFLVASSQHGATKDGSLLCTELMQNAPQLQYPLLKLGYLFCLLGYGTKAGMFPLHGWLPDAYSEAPAPASALLSAGLLNCSLFAIWRISEIVFQSGHSDFSQTIGVWSGVTSIFFASIFLIRQHGIKRLLAYSSIESVGLMLAAIGLHSGALFFILALNLGAAKTALFLLSGNIVQAGGSKNLNEISGVMTINPYWSGLFLLAVFALTGAPPFGAFVAEWQMLSILVQLRQWFPFCIILASFTLSFLAITMHAGRIITGTPRKQVITLPPIASGIIPACFVILTLLFGITVLPILIW